jgi:hypothetical protein
MTDLGRSGTTTNERLFRVARWGALAAALPALWACTNRPLGEPTPQPAGDFNGRYQLSVNRDLDILFMVDDSSSMKPLQNKLTANFPAFMEVLKNLPGGLPNVHIAVVSSSMGAGRNPMISHCAPGGDRGLFHAAPVGDTCGKGSLAPGQSFIVNVNGMTNYTGDISDVFSCIARLGDDGCGFEHQFESVLRALGADGAPPPPENAGFLRPNAYLAVILITNEDDCSAPPDSSLFDGSSQLISDPLGPLQSYRCNEFGHLCGGHPPPRTPVGPTDLTGTCTSAEDGRLLRVSQVVAALKGLKANPSMVRVAAIAGPANPYVVDHVPAGLPDVGPWPSVDHSCTTTEPDGMVTYGDPSVRIAEWVKAFGGNGVFETICAPTLEPALREVAKVIGGGPEPPCVEGRVLDTAGAPWTGATTPDCHVTDQAPNDQGQPVESVLPPCAPGQEAGATACWFLRPTADFCAGSPAVQFNRPGGAPTAGLTSTVSCAVLRCPPAGTPGAPDGC